MTTKIKVLVIMGGPSFEHEVSLISGKAISNALKESRFYQPVEVIIDKQGNFLDPEFYQKGEFVFIALHGPFGEDGTIQGFLEAVNKPYSGARVLASAIAMDKEITRRVLIAEGIPTVPTLFYSSFHQDQLEKINEEIKNQFGFPCVVKTPVSGSSIGVSLIESFSELESAINYAREFSNRYMIEENMTMGYLEGKEIECAVIGNDKPVALSLCELVPKNRYYDYEAKYKDGLTDFFIPARLSEKKISEAQDIAIKAYKAIGGEGFARVDMFYKNDKIFVGEINTIPGFTPTSVFPMLARHCGIGFTRLIEEIINLGYESFKQRKSFQKNFLKYPVK